MEGKRARADDEADKEGADNAAEMKELREVLIMFEKNWIQTFPSQNSQLVASGAYIPPFKLARLMSSAVPRGDRESESFQRLSFEALKKSIHGLVSALLPLLGIELLLAFLSS